MPDDKGPSGKTASFRSAYRGSMKRIEQIGTSLNDPRDAATRTGHVPLVSEGDHRRYVGVLRGRWIEGGKATVTALELPWNDLLHAVF